MKYIIILILCIAMTGCYTTNGTVSSKSTSNREMKSKKWDTFYTPKVKPNKTIFRK